MERTMFVVAFVLAAATVPFTTAAAALDADTTCAGVLGSNACPTTDHPRPVALPLSAGDALYRSDPSVNGVPVAINAADLASASNDTCIQPPQVLNHDRDRRH